MKKLLATLILRLRGRQRTVTYIADRELEAAALYRFGCAFGPWLCITVRSKRLATDRYRITETWNYCPDGWSSLYPHPAA